MARRILVQTRVLALAVVCVVPYHAAAKKPNLKTSYDVSLPPDPTQDVMTVVKHGCNGLTGKATDKHPFTVPAAGTLTVTLTSPDPTNKGVLDWALWLMDTDNVAIDHSDGSGANEQTTTRFKKKQALVIQTCNINGQMAGHVAIVFKYA